MTAVLGRQVFGQGADLGSASGAEVQVAVGHSAAQIEDAGSRASIGREMDHLEVGTAAAVPNFRIRIAIARRHAYPHAADLGLQTHTESVRVSSMNPSGA